MAMFTLDGMRQKMRGYEKVITNANCWGVLAEFQYCCPFHSNVNIAIFLKLNFRQNYSRSNFKEFESINREKLCAQN